VNGLDVLVVIAAFTADPAAHLRPTKTRS